MITTDRKMLSLAMNVCEEYLNRNIRPDEFCYNIQSVLYQLLNKYDFDGLLSDPLLDIELTFVDATEVGGLDQEETKLLDENAATIKAILSHFAEKTITEKQAVQLKNDFAAYGWQNCDICMENKKIIQIENDLQIVLPQSYKNLIKQFNGGSPDINCLTYYDENTGVNTTLDVCYFLSLNDREWGNFTTINNSLRDKNFIAFASDGSGGLFLFDYNLSRNDPSPYVVYNQYPDDRSHTEIEVAVSFEEFVNKLHKDI